MLTAGLLMLSELALVGAGLLLVWPRTARKVAKHRFNIASVSFRGHPYRRTLLYTQASGLTVCALGTMLLVWSVQL